VRVHRIDAPRAPHFDFLYTPAGMRALGQALAAERVDVAHCHVSIVSPAALGGALQAERRGIPTVLTFHSVVPRTQWLALGARIALGTTHWRSRFSAVSNFVARGVRPITGGRPLAILPNAIDTEFWRTQPKPPQDSTVELISVTRLNAKKRPLVLIKMMRRVNDLLRGRERVRLRIVGDGPQRRKLEQAIARFRLRDQVQLLGRRDRDEIRDLFAESDIFVLPSVRESFGLAALEARCAGVPVVAMANSGVSEIIHHGREGLLAHSNAELAAHVAALARDGERRLSIAAHNRESTPPFDWPRIVDAHVALYRDAVALRASV
jgi:glycosyltransferase involved in cell wall biosynthesis